MRLLLISNSTRHGGGYLDHCADAIVSFLGPSVRRVAFVPYAVSDRDAYAAADHHVRQLIKRVEPWDSGRRYLNFAESPMDPRSIYGSGYDRLRKVRAAYDPRGLFVPNHPV